MADRAAVLWAPDEPPTGRWEAAAQWTTGARSILRLSSLELDGVQLVAVRVEDTARRARRAAPAERIDR